jgi:hypothetical protein
MRSSDPEKRSEELNTSDSTSSSSAAYYTHHPDTSNELEDPFATPGTQTPNPAASRFPFSESRPESDAASSGATSGYQYFPRGEYFRSRRVKKGEIERPWLEKKDPREKWMTIIPLVGIFLGLCVVGVLVWDGVRSVAQHKYCEIFNDDFTSWNSNVWTKEVEVGGFG